MTNENTNTIPHDSDESMEEQFALNEKRIGGINIGGNTVTQATMHLPEVQRDLVRWLYSYSRAQKWSWPDLTAEVGIDMTTLFRLFRDRYRYPQGHTKAGQRVPIDGLCEKIVALQQRVRVISQDTTRVNFVETSVYKNINWLIERCAAHNRMGFVFGASQIGKTTALKESARTHDGGRYTYIEIPPGGVQLMAKKIAEGLNISANTSFDNLLTDIVQGVDSTKVLLFDEVQRIFTTYQKKSVMRCLDTLRYIHDQTKCGMILSGTDVFRDETRAGDFVKYLQQFNRRGRSYIVQLPTEPPIADLDLMAAHYGLEPATGDARQIMLKIGKMDGLGVFAMRLQDACELAKAKKEAVNWNHFVRAYAITEKASSSIAPQY